jgi:glycyl-tRNA synthetase beta chain
MPEVRADLLQLPVEKELLAATQAAQKAVEPMLQTGDFTGVFRRLTELQPLIDRFFTDVLVMDKDEAVKKNRLNLLLWVARLLWNLADFSRLVITEALAKNP